MGRGRWAVCASMLRGTTSARMDSAIAASICLATDEAKPIRTRYGPRINVLELNSAIPSRIRKAPNVDNCSLKCFGLPALSYKLAASSVRGAELPQTDLRQLDSSIACFFTEPRPIQTKIVPTSTETG